MAKVVAGGAWSLMVHVTLGIGAHVGQEIHSWIHLHTGLTHSLLASILMLTIVQPSDNLRTNLGDFDTTTTAFSYATHMTPNGIAFLH